MTSFLQAIRVLTTVSIVAGTSEPGHGMDTHLRRRSLQDGCDTEPFHTATTASDVPAYDATTNGKLNGELRIWHKITLGFTGPDTCERADPNPFTDYRLFVTFEHSGSGTTYKVPGYFAADGNAANTGASSGNVWLTHFAADRTGTWQWTADFVTGSDIAVSNDAGSSAGYFDGKTGSFDVKSTNKSGRDHRGKGLLRYVGEHHLQFAGNGEWFLKAGADSPENFLAYDDFDNTSDRGGRRKAWAPHVDDHTDTDPTWAGGKGKGIIGGTVIGSPRI